MPTRREQQIANIKTMQVRLGVRADGDFGPNTLAAFHLMADQAERNTQRDTLPDGTPFALPSLADRATTWCEGEADYWMGEQVNAERVAQYFELCDEDGSTSKGKWLAAETRAGKRFSFCGAAQGFAERQVLLPGETPLPSRAGAKQYRDDAVAGRRGHWVSVDDVRTGRVAPPPRGSLAIYDRPSTPETWDGHVRRVCESTRDGYLGVGANEHNRRWHRDVMLVPYTTPNLLGFVYP